MMMTMIMMMIMAMVLCSTVAVAQVNAMIDHAIWFNYEFNNLKNDNHTKQSNRKLH